MMEFLKDHPFAVEAFFERSLVLTYAVPKDNIQALVPECLQLDLLHDQWAFVAAAFVQTKHLRPKGFPTFMGNDFFLIGFRIFVRYRTAANKNLRGLYILKSETDKWKMAIMGNVFTHYNYTQTDIAHHTHDGQTTITSKKSGIELLVDTDQPEVGLPVGSPFADWKEARRFAGPLPFTFTYNAPRKEVLIIEGVRENWTPRPVQVIKQEIGFIKGFHLPGMVLANAFMIENIPYIWKKGKKEIWKP
jgi:hypothetical protein